MIIEQIGVVVFLVAWLAAGASWVYGLFESLAISQFEPWVFRYGKLVLHESCSIPIDAASVILDQIQETENAKFKFTSMNECLFCRKMRLFSAPRTPFRITGRVEWCEGRTTVEGRIPLGAILFPMAFLVGWTAGGLIVCRSLGAAFGLGFAAFGWLVVAGIFLFSTPLELRRARAAVGEIVGWLGKEV